ncbi:MAG: acyl-CoA dehydrogenase family protein [Pseudomonadota bacterium]|nr:acyl-CoA dehydrogenase family protein [Pseudomonadota bacterium]
MSNDIKERASVLREEVRRFCADELPPDIARKGPAHFMLNKEEYLRWMRLLLERRWAVGHWPKEVGGLGWTTLESYIFEDELGRAGCPWVIPFGVKYVGPVIYTFGTDAQKQRFLPKIIANEEWWAQGYSEPSAGSDLAGLRTSPQRDGNHYIVNGQKSWTTYAQWADWIFCLVRTSKEEKAQQGISFLLIDMKAPGVTLKPVRTMDLCYHVNEVWFDNARVPMENLVGAEGGGWKIAKFLLVNERTNGNGIGKSVHAIHRLREEVTTPRDGHRLIDEPAWQQRIAELELRQMALEAASYQAVNDMLAGTETGGEASFLKLRANEVIQDILEARVDALGHAGSVLDPGALHGEVPPVLGPVDAPGILRYHLYNRAATIYGGSSEVQKNIIAKMVLGL